MNINSIKEDKDLNLSDLLNVLLKKKIFILCITFIFSLSSVIYSLSLNNIYTSTVLLKPIDDSSNSSSNISSQFGGMASLAGISLGSPQNDIGEFVKHTVLSRKFLEHLLSFENVKQKLSATKSFDFPLQKIYYDEEIYNNDDDNWIALAEPSYLKVFEDYYVREISVFDDKDSGFISISFSHISPIFAKDFLDLIINQINELTRINDLNKSQGSLDYLYEKYTAEKNADIRDAISELIKSQIKIQTFAYIQEEYLVEIIDPPFAPEVKSSPQRSIICILAAFFGFTLSISFVIIREYLFDKELS